MLKGFLSFWSFLRHYPQLIICLTVLFGLGFTLHHEIQALKSLSRLSIARESEMMTRLNDLENQVEALSKYSDELSALTAELKQIQQTMLTEPSLTDVAKTQDVQQLTQQLKPLLEAHSANFQKARRPSTAHPAVTPASQPPFEILSLENLEGESFASVQYQNNSFLLRLNDQLAGWKMIQLDTVKGIVEWENEQHRRVTMALSESPHA